MWKVLQFLLVCVDMQTMPRGSSWLMGWGWRRWGQVYASIDTGVSCVQTFIPSQFLSCILCPLLLSLCVYSSDPPPHPPTHLSALHDGATWFVCFGSWPQKGKWWFSLPLSLTSVYERQQAVTGVAPSLLYCKIKCHWQMPSAFRGLCKVLCATDRRRVPTWCY